MSRRSSPCHHTHSQHLLAGDRSCCLEDCQCVSHTWSVKPTYNESCLGKILENFINKNLMPTVLSECTNQHAYLPKSSTTTALVKATHSWLTATDSKKTTMVRVLPCWYVQSLWVDHTKLLQHLSDNELCPRLLAPQLHHRKKAEGDDKWYF